MKTITEYTPLIFSRIEAYSALKAAQWRRLKIDALMVTGYAAVGWWLMWDTGLAPWDWRFWLCFGPFLLAAEMAAHQIAQAPKTSDEDCDAKP